jgi:acyl-coenzyme A thioesterase PaaI-like protein
MDGHSAILNQTSLRITVYAPVMSQIRPSDVPGALVTTDARRTLAALLRELGVAFLAHDVDEATLERLAGTVRAATEALNGGTERIRSFDEISREPEAEDVEDGGALGHFDGCFVTGEASPVGLTAQVRRDGLGLVATTRFPRSFEGMPGFAHGGILCAVFDDLIGLTIGRMMRISAPTVHVEVDFRQPVPLDTDVEFRTRVASSDGRKRIASATAAIGGVVYAEASALLIVLTPDQTFRPAVE